MRILSILLMPLFVCCTNETIDDSNYAELMNILDSIEAASDDLADEIENSIMYNLESDFRKGNISDSSKYHLVLSFLTETNEFNLFVSDWQNQLWNNAGYDEKGEMLNWKKKVELKEFRPKDKFRDLEFPFQKIKMSTIIALIELSNMKLEYITKLHDNVIKITSEIKLEFNSVLILANTVDSNNWLVNLHLRNRQDFSINNHRNFSFYAFKYYPVQYFAFKKLKFDHSIDDFFNVVDEKFMTKNDCLTVSIAEWERLITKYSTIGVYTAKTDTIKAFMY